MPWRWPWLLPLLLVPLTGDASPLVAPVAPAGLVLSELIGHFEPAVLDRAGLEAQMQERISRKRRDASSAFTFHEPISLRVATPHREFRMSLFPDREVFADNPEFETSKGQINYDATRVFQGTLEDDETATVRGVMTEEGLFDGTISTPSEEFYVEPVSRYLGSGDEINRKPNFDTVVYRGSDVRRPLLGSKDGIWCASQRLYERQRRSKRWFQEDGSQHPPLGSSRSGSIHFSANRTVLLVTGRPLSVPGHGGTQRNANNHFHTPTHTHRPTIIVTSSGKDLDPSLTFAEADDNVNKNIIGGGDRSSSGHNPSSLSGPHATRKRATVDPNKTTCMLYLQADHLFYKKYGSEEACIEVMTRHVQRVNAIYKATDFNQDGKPDNISFMIKRIKVHTTDALKDPSYRFPQNYGVEKFLELFSEEDYDAFCLAYMFTYRDFEMGTLGLAWTGDLKNAGGVCEKNGHYRGSLKSLNTGIVTLLNYGKHVPPAVSHVTLAHEIGHNFGSPHDPEQCTPGGEDGNFIMFARATSGDKRNNNKFSPCSLNSINPVLNTKARSSKGCFSEPQVAICGNGVVEPGEECDCGWEEDCRDQCCHPQRKHPSPEEPPCKLTPRSVCSPSQGPCCTGECRLRFGDKCRDDNGCRDSSFCDGRAPQCPPSINKPNKTICNQEFVCFMGECTGSICLAYGLESCQCIPASKDPVTKACELCCKLPGDDQQCLSSFVWNTPPYDIPDLFSKPGTPCNNYNGYCDVFQRCREVDPSGPLATLRKLLLSDESLATFKLWIVQHWYAVALIISAVITLLVLSTKFLGKRPNTKLKAITIIHSSTTETVRLPPEGGDGGNGVTVHPGVRSKLPLKKRVREARAKRSRPRGKSGEQMANLSKEAGKSKKEKLKKIKPNRTSGKNPPKEIVVPASTPPNVVSSPTEDSKRKSKTHSKVIDYSNVQEKNKITIAGGSLGQSVTTAEPPADPIGKVKSWLVSSQPPHAPSTSTTVVPKSKSTPAGLAMAANRGGTKPRTSSATPKYSPSDSKDKLRIHVVYKPPFRFSLKLRRPEKVNGASAPAAGATAAPTNGSPRKARMPGQRVLLRTREREHRSGVAKRAHKRNKKLNSPKKTSAGGTSPSHPPTSSAPPPESADVIDTAVPSDLEVLLSESEFLFSDG